MSNVLNDRAGIQAPKRTCEILRPNRPLPADYSPPNDLPRGLELLEVNLGSTN